MSPWQHPASHPSECLEPKVLRIMRPTLQGVLEEEILQRLAPGTGPGRSAPLLTSNLRHWPRVPGGVVPKLCLFSPSPRANGCNVQERSPFADPWTGVYSGRAESVADESRCFPRWGGEFIRLSSEIVAAVIHKIVLAPGTFTAGGCVWTGPKPRCW